MKKGRWFLLVLITIVTGCEKEDSNPQVISINGGIQFGFCVGYCKKEIQVSETKMIFSQGPTRDQTIPEKRCTIELIPSDWQNIEMAVDDAFFELDEEYGCPDCADQGEEWVEVVTKDRNHKVTFDPTLKINIHPLVEYMRTLRQKAEEEETCL